MTASPPTPFFVLGFPRSGTTALAHLLNASDQVACLYYEGNLLYRLHRILSRDRVLEEPHSDLITDFDVTARHNLIEKPKRSGILKPVFEESAVAAITEGFAEALKKMQGTKAIFRSTAERFFRSFSGAEDFRALGDKVPDYINIPEALQAAMPRAKLIYIQRDIRASVHSVLRFAKGRLHLFAAPDAFAVAFAWLLRHRGMVQFRRRIESQRLLVLRQEDLGSDPFPIAQKALEFLDVSLDPPVRRHMETVSRRPGIRDWHSEMAAEDVKAVESVIIEAGISREISGLLYEPHRSGWSEKAAALMPLVDCKLKELPGAIENSRGCFEDPLAKETLGLTLVQFADWAHVKGDWDRASILFEEAARLLPEDPVFLYKYGEFCFDTKRLIFAGRLLQRAIKACPETDYFRFLKAKILYQLGRIERLSEKKRAAESYYKKSLDAFEDFALPQAMLANLSG